MSRDAFLILGAMKAGTTALYHLAILYPTRAALAAALRRLVKAGVELDGDDALAGTRVEQGVDDLEGLGPFVDELRDGADIVDWIVAQPWSDGRVGAWGNSYTGGSALLLR